MREFKEDNLIWDHDWRQNQMFLKSGIHRMERKFLMKYRKGIEVLINCFLLISLLAGCGTEQEKDMEKSVSEDLIEEIEKTVSDNQIDSVGGSYFSWRGIEGKFGGNLVIRDVEKKEDCITYKVGGSHKLNESGEITISQVDVLPGEEEEWMISNIIGTRKLYRCDYEDSSAYYYYTYTDCYKEILVCDGNAFYYITASEMDNCKGALGEDILIRLGENEHVSYICDFYNVKEADNMHMLQIKRAGENICGMFVQNGS